jgi:hypothetical protein
VHSGPKQEYDSDDGSEQDDTVTSSLWQQSASLKTQSSGGLNGGSGNGLKASTSIRRGTYFGSFTPAQASKRKGNDLEHISIPETNESPTDYKRGASDCSSRPGSPQAALSMVSLKMNR